ncbi:amino acid ABC transporter substrate-binding protein [Pseudonocardia sp. RS010]|uniref:amino acid ABC transporter substrate-binding protein n=1 Tax=Pseudonocardia sp. RS010 TaxID=3385979 RepID=UPI0039A06D6B
MSRTTDSQLLPTRSLLAVLLTACALVAGCSATGPDGGDGPIRIGGSLGLTGSLAAPAAEYHAIYDAWAEDVNARGGLLGRKVEMDIKNDSSTAAGAATQYQTLLTKDQVDLVLAPYSTFVGAAVVPIVKSSGKLMFNGGFPDTGLSDAAGGRMLTAYPYQPQDYTKGMFSAVAELPEQSRPKTVAILTNNNPFTLDVRDGHDGVGGARAYALDAGMSVVFDETYNAETGDFTGVVGKAKASGADLFLVLGLPEDTTTILKATRTVGYQPKLVCACGSQVITLPSWKDLGPATEGVVGGTGSWPSQNFPGTDALVRISQGRGETVIPAYSAVAFASLQILEQAVQGAGTLDQEKIKDFAYSHTFETVVGPIRFEPNGTASYRQVLLQTVDGEVTPVWPKDVAQTGLRTTAAAP